MEATTPWTPDPAASGSGEGATEPNPEMRAHLALLFSEVQGGLETESTDVLVAALAGEMNVDAARAAGTMTGTAWPRASTAPPRRSQCRTTELPRLSHLLP